ncbi:MAG TPA: signal peptide peptidase SppA [Chloroflexi bacterium]|nr:signal peptide peptidase SppA [Chloroflexota bacterium]
MSDEQLSPRPASVPPEPRRRSRAWLWILLIVMLGFVSPVAACGAFGYGLASGSSQPLSASLRPAVGVIRVEGPIVPGEASTFSTNVAASETIIDLIERADADPNVRAIVLRIDSPGGGVTASDEIYHALRQVDKPVVVSMGTLAASGGYYIAAAADYIYATPHTLTGSIGVISQFVIAEELLDEVGIEIVVIASGEAKDFGSIHRQMTDEERAYWQALTDEIYEGFVEVVAEGRQMSVEDVRALADGRVYTGQRALDLGLVDEIGYFDDAVEKAAELGGISGEPAIVEFRPEVGLLDALYGFQSRRSGFSLDMLRELSVPSLEFLLVAPAPES